MSTSTSPNRQISATIRESTFTLPHPEVLLRPLQESDLLGLEWHGGEDLRSFYQKQWEKHQAKYVLVVVAEFNNSPIGQAAIHWLGKPTHPHIPDIQSVRVMDVFQGQGIGTRLLEMCESIVRSEGFPWVTLAVALDNEGAKRLYERLNYRVTGMSYDDKWSYIDAKGHMVEVSELVTDLTKDL
ncbi:MAG: GNAT family N-acetyltransferase [Abditibacteriaceae bacterium]